MTPSASKERTWLGHMNTGKRNFQQGNMHNAAQAFNAATKLLPARVEGWVNLGSALFEAQRYDIAAAALQKAAAMNPALMVTHLLLGDALRMLGHWRAASGSYHKAVALQRTPLALNKLACALRVEGKPELAEGLYREALEIDPDFSLARVNLATVQLELQRYSEAEKQLGALAQLSLPPVERREVEFAQLAVSEYSRLHQAIAELVEHHNPMPLETALRHAPTRMTHIDKGILASLQRYANCAQQRTSERVAIDPDLPDEWPLIEAMVTMPLVNSVDKYQAIKAKLQDAQQPSIELLAALNRQAAITAARACQLDMRDPVKAELHLRHWHALACHNMDGFQPAHFKYTQNWVSGNPTLRRVEPALASTTFRHFIGEIYNTLSPGYARAAVVYMAIIDLHLFADGNGRIAVIWLNRELEWAGLMPALFSRDLGPKGELGNALKAVRSAGDVAPIIAVLARAQDYARQFCAELTEHGSAS